MAKKVNLPTPNITELRLILKEIETHPETWVQDSWAQQLDCGTTYCVAGHAVHRAGFKIDWYPSTSSNDGIVAMADSVIFGNNRRKSIDSVATDVLGLTTDEADELFGEAETLDDIRGFIDRLEAEHQDEAH